MEMRVVEDIAIGRNLTPPILPIAAALHDSSRFSHCSACFSPLHDSPDSQSAPLHFLRYCSRRCSSLDSSLHFSSAEFHLLRHSPAPTLPETSDLRLSLRLLHLFETLRLFSRDSALDRIGGLMTNRAELLRKEIQEDMETCEEYEEVSERIREGARAMAAARRMRDGLNLESSLAEDCAVEEAVLCLVLTNAVEVQDRTGCSVGVAVYGPRFSWINHSCSPNSSYWFSTVPSSGAASSGLIHPKPTDGDNRNGSELINTKISFKFLSSLGIEEGYGPSLIIRSIKNIKQGEELLITYTDLLQPKVVRG
ncbi:unnamed protein product [Cuscuta epithymum]|uniref:SET domain-containing protein n=1 Tax=Cuscuta epithymum TaxID=186058 RepID=A0AAV0C7L5_9ASTE|nr:unnamed protein product [Cuscuta epithymum]